jgi:hypothetical protein
LIFGIAASWQFPEAVCRNLILARSRRLWELHNFAAPNAVSAWRGNRPIAKSVVAAAHNASWQFHSLRSICISSRLERDHSRAQVGIGPVDVRPFDKCELPP